jgi:hypothetical protein
MSGDFDPRDVDSRERDDGIHDHEDEWLTLGRGPGSAVVRDGDEDVRERDDDWRAERDREPHDRDNDRGLDPRDVFMRDLDLPRGPERELVHDRDRDYTLNGSESRTLATVGSFRIVSERDLRDARDDAFDLRHLEDHDFTHDLADRVSQRVQITTDGFKVYLEAVESAFYEDLDYAVLQKVYGSDQEPERRYSPAKIISSHTEVIKGTPNPKHISTSYVERLNWSTRTSMRRYTRLSNGFSRKLENHEAAVALNYFAYNFIKIHRTLRVTPAMAANVTDRLFDVSDIVQLLEESESKKAA